MVICAQKNQVICLPKRYVQKITTGEKFVTVHYIKEHREMKGTDVVEMKYVSAFIRCHWIIVDGQKIMPNDSKTDEQFEKEFEEIAALKDRVAKLEAAVAKH